MPEAAVNEAEQPAMINLRTTYGKTIHTWQYDIHPDLPLVRYAGSMSKSFSLNLVSQGPPQLMQSFTADGQLPELD